MVEWVVDGDEVVYGVVDEGCGWCGFGVVVVWVGL